MRRITRAQKVKALAAIIDQFFFETKFGKLYSKVLTAPSSDLKAKMWNYSHRFAAAARVMIDNKGHNCQSAGLGLAFHAATEAALYLSERGF